MQSQAGQKPGQLPEKTAKLVNCLINHYIPRHGFPEKIRTVNGTHFKNQDLQRVEASLGLKHRFGTVYHPQGKVERMNQNLKNKLAKICAQNKLSWVVALPLALMSIRCSINFTTGYTPFELTTGQCFPGPQRRPPDLTGDLQQLTQKDYFHQLHTVRNELTWIQGEGQDKESDLTAPEAAWVWLKVIKRKWSEPRFTGPHQVIEHTSHAFRLKRKGENWYHWSQCVLAEEPGRELIKHAYTD